MAVKGASWRSLVIINGSKPKRFSNNKNTNKKLDKNTRVVRFLTSFSNWIVACFCVLSFQANAAKIAIVIDDIGYKISDQKLIDLDGALTYAVLPHTPLGPKLAQQAAVKDRDVIIHLPMQAHKDNRLLGPGALYSEMNKAEYQQTLISAMEDLPFAIGVNNHMGSLLTQQTQPMTWTMEFLQQHNLFFLDSRTTKFSKVSEVAGRFGVETLNRNVFLDNSRDPKQIEIQFNRLLKLAKQNGSAVAIGHPHKETYALLEAKLPMLKEMGVELVPLSDLLEDNPVRSMLASKDSTSSNEEEYTDTSASNADEYAPKE